MKEQSEQPLQGRGEQPNAGSHIQSIVPDNVFEVAAQIGDEAVRGLNEPENKDADSGDKKGGGSNKVEDNQGEMAGDEGGANNEGETANIAEKNLSLYQIVKYNSNVEKTILVGESTGVEVEKVLRLPN